MTLTKGVRLCGEGRSSAGRCGVVVAVKPGGDTSSNRRVVHACVKIQRAVVVRVVIESDVVCVVDAWREEFAGIHACLGAIDTSPSIVAVSTCCVCLKVQGKA